MWIKENTNILIIANISPCNAVLILIVDSGYLHISSKKLVKFVFQCRLWPMLAVCIQQHGFMILNMILHHPAFICHQDKQQSFKMFYDP